MNVHYALKIIQGLQCTGYLLSSQEHFHQSLQDIKNQILRIISQVYVVFHNMLKQRDDIRLRQILSFMGYLASCSRIVREDPQIQTILKEVEHSVVTYSEVKEKLLELEGQKDSNTFLHRNLLLGDFDREDQEEYLYSIHNLRKYSFNELCQFFYYFTELQSGSEPFLKFLSQTIQSRYLLISRKNFTKMYYSLLQYNQHQIITLLGPVIQELHKYGDFKYFFNHDDFIRLIWSVTAHHIGAQFPILPEDHLGRVNEIPNLFILKAPFYDALEDEDIFQRNFEVMKNLTSFSKQSLTNLLQSILDINPNTLSPNVL